MGISETKKQIVINNYFKRECNVNTSIKEAFTKGFEIGLKKVPIPQQKTGHWIGIDTNMHACSNCSHCFSIVPEDNSIKQYKYCPNCGARMESEE